MGPCTQMALTNCFLPYLSVLATVRNHIILTSHFRGLHEKKYFDIEPFFVCQTIFSNIQKSAYPQISIFSIQAAWSKDYL